MSPEEIRAWVDEQHPRLLDSGEVNPDHRALERRARQKSGLSRDIPELDDPDKFAR